MIDSSMLAARMAAGSGLQGSNVVSAIQRFTWEEELSEIALLRLIQLFAHYEGWLESVAAELLPHAKARTWAKDMTFPGKFQAALASLGSSKAMTELYSSSKPHPYFVKSALGEVVTCIRYFKEIRNCAIHRGRRADSSLLSAQADYDGVLLHGVLVNAYRPPNPSRVSAVGDVTSVSHYAIIGLTGLVQRAIATLDALVGQTAAGEMYYLERWRLTNHQHHQLPANPTEMGGLSCSRSKGWTAAN